MTVPIPDYARVRIDMLSQGNRRACGVCEELFNKFGDQALIMIEKLNIRGLGIWILFFNDCRGDLDKMKAELARRGAASSTSVRD